MPRMDREAALYHAHNRVKWMACPDSDWERLRSVKRNLVNRLWNQPYLEWNVRTVAMRDVRDVAFTPLRAAHGHVWSRMLEETRYAGAHD